MMPSLRSVASGGNDVQIRIATTADNSGLESTQNSLRNTSDQAEKSSAKFAAFSRVAATSIASIGAIGGAAALAGGAIGFNFNSSVEQAQTKLSAFMNDNEKVAQTLAWVKDEAAKTQFSFTDMADAAANLTPVAKSSGKSLEDLVKQAEILAAVNPAEGLTGATFSLREALSGDWVSITDRFNLPRKRINELKEEGVPAMEIISRTLGEMGINYDLVAKQGQTVSARFDQVKDKLTMMAGAATKPIFDRVSKELETLGGFDFATLGDNMAGITKNLLDTVDQLIPKIKEFGTQVGEFLGPKIGTLWKSIDENLIPILTDLWKNVLEPLVPVIAETLVGAIGLLIDTITFLVDGLGYLYQCLKEGDPVVMGLAGVFGTLAAAMAFNTVFNALSVGFATFQLVTIPAAIASIGTLKALIMSPMVMPAIAVGAALFALGQVYDAATKAHDAIKLAQSAESTQTKTNQTLYQRASEFEAKGDLKMAAKMREIARSGGEQSKTGWAYLADWWNELPTSSVAGFATGTSGAPGGMAWVGERGPELVNLPQGSQVYNANNSSRMGDQMQSSGSKIEVTQHIYNEVDYEKGFRELGFRLAMR